MYHLIIYLDLKKKVRCEPMEEVKKILIKERYDIIHCNMNSAVMLYPLIAAKLAKTPIIISHSHN